VFPPGPRSFEVKVNRKARRSAFRSALSAHASAGTFAVLGDAAFDEPSTRTAAELLQTWGGQRPLVVVALLEQDAIAKSFRNLDRVVVTTPDELEVAAVVWARALLVTESALPLVEGRAA
jgi:large subunit ribosomal protein L4